LKIEHKKARITEINYERKLYKRKI